jgi:hypothetical protein
MGQNCAVLMIVIDHEKPEIKEPRKHAAHDSSGQVKVPDGPGQSQDQEKRG